MAPAAEEVKSVCELLPAVGAENARMRACCVVRKPELTSLSAVRRRIFGLHSQVPSSNLLYSLILLIEERVMPYTSPFDQPTPDEIEFAENAAILVTWNASWHVDHVRYLACRAKDFDERSKGRAGDSTRCTLGQINRWTLNRLRHEYSNYDRLLDEFGRESPYVAKRLKEQIQNMALEVWTDLADLASNAKWCRARNRK